MISVCKNFLLGSALVSLAVLGACTKKKSSDKSDAASSDDSVVEESVGEVEVIPTSVAGYLNEIATCKAYGILTEHSNFFVDGKMVVQGSDQCITRDDGSLPLPTYIEGFTDAAVPASEIATWNTKVTNANLDVTTNLENALKAKPCLTPENFATVFPELAAYDKYWEPSYISAIDLEDWAKVEAEPGSELAVLYEKKPATISKDEFIKRMSCLGTFTIETTDVAAIAADRAKIAAVTTGGDTSTDPEEPLPTP